MMRQTVGKDVVEAFERQAGDPSGAGECAGNEKASQVLLGA